MNGACKVKLFLGPAPWGPGEGPKGQISFNFNYEVNFKDFYTKLCLCFHKWKIQNISDGIFILSPGSCPRGGTWGAQGVKKFFFSNIVMWHIKSTGMTSRTECKLNFHPRVKLVTLGWGQRSNIIKFRLPCQFHRFLYQTLCVFSQKIDRKTYWKELSFCCQVHAPGRDWRESKTLAWGFAMAPHRLRALVYF